MSINLFERALVWYARRFPYSKGKLRVVGALWRLAAGNDGHDRIGRLIYGGYEIPCDLREIIQRQLYFFGTYHVEREGLKCWTSISESAQVVFDVGANVGIYSLAALAGNPKAKVHAFEPTPEIAAQLRDTASRNQLSSLHVHELAILDHAGSATLHQCRGDGGTNGGMNYITTDLEPSGTSVSATTLDDFCSRHGIAQIDALKMDIQGHEASALKGARELLRQGRITTIFLELNWSTDLGVERAATAALDILNTYEFQFAEPKLPLRWRASGAWLRELTDVIAQRRPA